MKVRDLQAKLFQCDPDAEVYLLAEERGSRSYSVVRNGDALWMVGGVAHIPGQAHVYITDIESRWLDEIHQPV